MATRVERIETALDPIVSSHGLELAAVELAGAGQKPIVRVFLDRSGGITLDEIAEANTWIGEAIDALGEPAGPYLLEVSSPGIERPLRKPGDFARFCGQRAEVRTLQAHDGRKRFTGTITAADDEAVTLDVDGETVRLPYDGMSRARLRVDIEFADEGIGSKR